MQNIYSIPYISDRKAEVKVKKIRPISNKGKKKVYLGNYDLDEIKKQSFRAQLSKHAMEEVDFSTLQVIGEISTLHKIRGTASKFQPTLSEIYAQIPEDIARVAVAFECTFKEDVNEDFQRGVITLYGMKV